MPVSTTTTATVLNGLALAGGIALGGYGTYLSASKIKDHDANAWDWIVSGSAVLAVGSGIVSAATKSHVSPLMTGMMVGGGAALASAALLHQSPTRSHPSAPGAPGRQQPDITVDDGPIIMAPGPFGRDTTPAPGTEAAVYIARLDELLATVGNQNQAAAPRMPRPLVVPAYPM